MRSTPTLRFALLALLCGVMLLVRGFGVHLHFCFDGQEPMTTVHLGDSGLQNADHPAVAVSDAAAPHDDVDVDLLTGHLAKTAKVDGSLIALLLVVALFVPNLRQPIGRPRLSAAIVPKQLIHLRPPLRGPPVLSVV